MLRRTRAFKELTTLTRDEMPFLLVGVKNGNQPYSDVRTSLDWLAPAVGNYFSNANLAPVGPLTIYLWQDDMALLTKVGDDGKSPLARLIEGRSASVNVCFLEDYAAGYKERATAFLEGYSRLIAETGFHISVDCESVAPMLAEGARYSDPHKLAATAGGLCGQ